MATALHFGSSLQAQAISGISIALEGCELSLISEVGALLASQRPLQSSILYSPDLSWGGGMSRTLSPEEACKLPRMTSRGS